MDRYNSALNCPIVLKLSRLVQDSMGSVSVWSGTYITHVISHCDAWIPPLSDAMQSCSHLSEGVTGQQVTFFAPVSLTLPWWPSYTNLILFPRDTPDVQIRTSYVKAFESCRMTDIQYKQTDRCFRN